MNDFSSATMPDSIVFTVSNVALFDSLRIEQRITAVSAGELTFTAETSDIIKTQFIRHFSQIALDHRALIQWEDAKFFILFGYPTLFEDDAIQCAQLIWQLYQFANGSPIITSNQFALTLHTTTVQQIPTATNKQLIVNGAGIRQAAQLLSICPSSGIWATDDFYSAAQHEFEFETAVITISDNSVWQLKGRRQVPQKARGFKTLSSGLIGRDQALLKMLTVAQNLEKGSGGIIIIEGEPGIGKSRLMQEFCSSLPIENKTIINGKCTPQRTHYPFSLFTTLIANAFNIRLNDSIETNQLKIQLQTASWPEELNAFVPYIYTLLGLKEENQPSETLDPNQTRQQIFVAIRRILKTLSQQSPIVLLLDDLHWIDPISAELLLFLATTIATDPIFFICTQRRQGADAPNDRLKRLQSLLVGQTETIFLERLSSEETLILLQNLLDGAEIPETFAQLITAKSEGNPYFIEEFVRMFIEQGFVSKANGRWQFSNTPNLAETDIPLSLTTLIQARIAALPPELKLTLEWAAILGLYFDASTLESNLPNEKISDNLDRLASRLMMHYLGDFERWQFHHPLLHTAVYNAIPKAKRQEMHKQIAANLQTSVSNETPETAELLAYHLTQADEQRQAIPYLIKAGQLAIEHHAGEEALNHFQHASEFTEQITNPKSLWYWEIILGMGTAYRFLGRYAESSAILETGLHLTETNQEFIEHRITILRELGDTNRKQGEVKTAENYYHTALKLLQDPQNQEMLLKATQIHVGLGWLYFSQAKFDDARIECQKILDYAKKTNHLGNLASAENLLGGIAYRLGDWQEAMRHTTRAKILREEMGDSGGIAASLANLGLLALESGHWPKAISYFQESLALRQDIGDIEGIVIDHNNLAFVYRNQGDFSLAEEHQRQCLQIALQFNMAYNIANANLELSRILLSKDAHDLVKTHLSNAKKEANAIEAKGLLIEIATTEAQFLLVQSSWEEALIIAQDTLKKAETIGNKIYEVVCWRIIAESSLSLQREEVALDAITKAKNLISDSKNNLEIGETAALAYKIYSQLGNIDEAQSAFQQAEAIFKKLGAKFFLERLNKPII